MSQTAVPGSEPASGQAKTNAATLASFLGNLQQVVFMQPSSLDVRMQLLAACKRIRDAHRESPSELADALDDHIDALDLIIDARPAYERTHTFATRRRLLTRVALSQLAFTAVPLSPTWVLAAASIHRDCEPELFKAMEDDQYRSWFAREYRGNYPTGLRVPAGPRCAIDIAAFPPSPGPSIYLRFGNEAEYDSNGGWATALLHLARKAYGDLKEFLASKAEGKADFALLPRDAVRELAPESYTALLSATLAAVHEKRVLRWRELFDFFGCAEPDAGRATRIASVLATIGRFMEPSPAELVDEYVAFYHAESTGGDSTNYRMAQEAVDYLMPRMRHHGRLVLEIATSIAAALRLSADHRARLLARGVWSFSRQTEPIGQPSDATRLLLGRLWSFAVEANHAWTKLEGASAALGRRLEKLLVTSAAPAPSQTSPQQARIPSRPAASVMVEVLPISRAQLQSALGAMDAARQLASAELQRPSTAYLSTVERSMLDQLLHRPFTIEQFRDLCRHHAIFVDAFADKINEVSLDLCRAEAIQTYPTFAVNLPALRAVTQGE